MSIRESIGTLFYVILLLINAVAILHEERFLARIGLAHSSSQAQFGDQTQTVKYKIINLISAIRTLLRFPLVAINIVIIVYELIFGSIS
ncbi:Yos1-like protein [Fimicolochytrium jonesii]|uniref:Yos1-like protein n=1 Tax=Fimicolochytrium jonesii TaxID=1396493 RepID=UPI0022FE2543|nr:Yos1-like protein [Fimicolochytrium jonesii]KAI8821457.1 Yos1-like protein [Fimicolochytrium jonesii]